MYICIHIYMCICVCVYIKGPPFGIPLKYRYVYIYIYTLFGVVRHLTRLRLCMILWHRSRTFRAILAIYVYIHICVYVYIWRGTLWDAPWNIGVYIYIYIRGIPWDTPCIILVCVGCECKGWPLRIAQYFNTAGRFCSMYCWYVSES